MEDREIICIVCGKKIVDRRIYRNRKYCSETCAYHGYRKMHGIGREITTPSCIHNQAIACESHRCSRCGWNPEVEQKRKAAMV